MNNSLRYLEWENWSILAIAGKSGSGKTNTAKFLLAQLMLDEYDIFLCDPHTDMHPLSLGATFREKLTVATTKAERMKVIRHITQVQQRSLSERVPKTVLVFDEITAHFLECTPDEAKETEQLFMRMANEGRKGNVRLILCGQNWRAEYIGNRSIRSSITHYIFHQISDDEIKLFLPSLPTDKRRKIISLAQGDAYVFPQDIFVHIPYVSSDEIRAIRAKILHPLAPLPHAENSPSVQKVQNVQKVEYLVARILARRAEGKNKEEIIYELFKIRKSGTSEKWKKASEFYDKVIAKRG